MKRTTLHIDRDGLTYYGLDCLGIESWWGQDFLCSSDQPWGPSSLLYNGYQVFSRHKATGAWCWPPASFSYQAANG